MKNFTNFFFSLFITGITIILFPTMVLGVKDGSKGTVTDIDGNVYTTVVIGQQEWMAENLKVTRYQNGDAIPNGTGLTGLATQAYYFMYEDNPSYASEYGLLYTGYVALNDKEVCPAGWTVPTNDQVKVMEMVLGMSWKMANTVLNPIGHGQDEGGKLKQTGHEHWKIPNVGATDEYGFSFLPAGLRTSDFDDLGYSGVLLTSPYAGNVIMRRYRSFSSKIISMNASLGIAGSIRCIRINENQYLPSVTTGDLITVTPTSARIGGAITGNGNSDVVAYGLIYSNYSENHYSHNTGEAGAFTGEFVNLLPGTTYNVRAYAVNAKGVGYGEVLSFTTPEAQIPQLGFILIDHEGQTTITITSSVDFEGESSVTSRGVVYAEWEFPTTNDNFIIAQEDAGNFTIQITGLEPNTLYFLKSFATNEQGTAYSNNSRFVTTVTDKPAPLVETQGVEQVTTNSAVVKISITDDGGYEILKCGVKVTHSGDSFEFIAQGEGNDFSLTLANLLPNTEYSVQAYAANENGMAYGEILTFSTLFENTQQAQVAMDRVYNYMFELGSGHDNFGIKSFDLTSDLMGEDMVMHSAGYGWFFTHYRYVSQAYKTSTLVQNTWLRFYKKIDMANFVLANIEAASGSGTDKNKIKAQALAMRAFSHFQLLQVFSHPLSFDPDAWSIPYITENSKELDGGYLLQQDEENNQSENLVYEWGNHKEKATWYQRKYRAVDKILEREKVSEVYEHLQSDLDQAISLLEGSGVQNQRSHIDLSVAHGLRARVALAMEEWDVAAQNAALAITIAKANGKRLFNIGEFTADVFNTTTAVEWMWGLENNNDHPYNSFFSHMDAGIFGYASVGAQKKITASLYNQYSSTDIRRSLFISPGTGSGDLVDYNQMKFLRRASNPEVGNFLLMRLSEMYLILAEAQAKGSASDAEAYQSLSEVISRRDPEYDSSSNTGQELVDEILLQRRLELWGEGHRFLDIRRQQLPLIRPSGEGNHADTDALNIPANDYLFLWKIPFYSVLNIEFTGFGKVEVENKLYVNSNPPLVADESLILLKAIPKEGHFFINWQKDGEIISTDPEFYYLTGDQDVNLTVNFTLTVNVPETRLLKTRIFPNPASNDLYVQSDYNIESILLYTITGQLVFSEKVNQKDFHLKVNNLDNGVYVIKVITSDGASTGKVVIQ